MCDRRNVATGPWLSGCWQDYGANSQKATWLYSNFDCLNELDNHTTGPGPEFGQREISVRYIDKQGDRKWKGGCDLKKSQEYTKPFARALKKTVLKVESKVRERKHDFKILSRLSSRTMRRDAALWEDAELQSVLSFLTSDP
jgi:hypothetical protein